MSEPIIPRDEVARQLAVSARLLLRYEARGLVHVRVEGPIEGYTLAEARRIGSIVSYQRDLGINLAGVEAVLKLREHLADVHRRLHHLADNLIDALDASSTEPPDA